MGSHSFDCEAFPAPCLRLQRAHGARGATGLTGVTFGPCGRPMAPTNLRLSCVTELSLNQLLCRFPRCWYKPCSCVPLGTGSPPAVPKGALISGSHKNPQDLRNLWPPDHRGGHEAFIRVATENRATGRWAFFCPKGTQNPVVPFGVPLNLPQAGYLQKHTHPYS